MHTDRSRHIRNAIWGPTTILLATTLLTVILLTMALPWTAIAEDASPRVFGPGSATDRPQIQVVSANGDGCELEFSLPALLAEDVAAAGETFQALAIPWGGVSGQVGQPMLPTFTRFLAIPDRADVHVNATVEQEEELDGFRLLPVQADNGPFAFDPTSYARDAFDDQPTAQVGTPALIRGLRVVSLRFSPVSYNPAQGKLRVARRVRISVSFAGENLENATPAKTRPLAPSFAQLFSELVINDPIQERDVQPGSWLIICPNDNGVIQRLQPLLNWRQRKGLATVLATTAQTGTSSSQIKAYIQNAYDNWSSPLEYVVLAGDASGAYNIPTWYESISGYNGEGDHPYTMLQGNDVLSDVHIGRLSFNTLTELETIVNKIVGYESAPLLQDPGWFGRACLVGDPSNSGFSVVQVMQWVKTRLRQLGYAQIDTVFGGSFVGQMTTALNQGDTVFSYRGYLGMSGWTNSNVNAMANGWKMPFCVISTCGTGSFVTETSISEAFLRAGTPTNPRGGIGSTGTATWGTHTRFNNCYCFGVFAGLLYEGQYTLGAAHTRGKYELYLNYNNTPESNDVTIFSYWNNLMGDPATECWTGFPSSLTVSHPTNLYVGGNSCVVSVQDGGNPAADAQVSLWKGTETYAVGRTDATGVCELPVSLLTSGSLLLTVTQHNRQPYLATVVVTSPVRLVSYQSSTLSDDNTGQSHGNGDGQVNPGETVELTILLKNFGTQPAAGVTAILSTQDPMVTVVQPGAGFGDIAPGGTAANGTPFVITVDPACPHGHLLTFGLDVTSGTDVWHSLVTLPVISADLTFRELHLYNAGNGVLDPGETVQLSVRLNNQGGLGATALTATLFSLSQFINVPGPSASYPNIPAGGNDENVNVPFTIHAADDAFRGYTAHLKMVVEFCGGMRDTVFFSLPIATAGTSDPTGPDAYGYYAFDNTDVSYPQAPTYGWIECDPAYGGSGTEIQLGDNGDYQDKSRTIDMPFAFPYYGASYTQATVCSNGWMVMGQTYLTDYRNTTIPGMGGPNGVIAAFWDDLNQNGGGKALQKYDATAHKWIVEWSHFRNSVGYAEETFEIIFYDPAYYPTGTGDGMIEFQYKTVNNVDGTDAYATVGIERQDNSDGVLYSYFAQYRPGAATLMTGRSIRFVPIKENLVGIIQGTVRNVAAGGTPISGATITVLQNGHQYMSGGNGTYTATEAEGTYTLTARRIGFAPDTVSGVQVLIGSSQTIDFDLLDNTAPRLTELTLPVSTADSLGPYPVMATIGDYSPLSETSVYYRAYDGSFQRLNLAAQGLGRYRAEIPGQKWTTRVDYYVLARDVAGNVTTIPSGAPEQTKSFWVAPLLVAFSDDLETDQGWTPGLPGDDAVSGIWERCDPNVVMHGSDMVQPEDDHTPDPGTLCYITGNSPPGSDQDFNDVDGGRTTLLSPRLDLTIDGQVLLRYWRWYTNDTGPNPGEDFWTVQASSDDGATWTTLESTNISDRSWRLMEFDLGGAINLTDSVRLRFVAEDLNGPSIVEAGLDDVQIVYFGLTAANVAGHGPVRFGLAANQTNPLRPGGQIRFFLDRPGEVSLILYDAQGRVIRHLLRGALLPGGYALPWDGRNDLGRALSSGVYFSRLVSGGRSDTQKMLMAR